MRTDFQNYLIDAINDQIEDFGGDMERYGEVFGMTDVQLDDLAYDDALTFDHIGYWVVIIDQDGRVSIHRYRSYSLAEQELGLLKAGYHLWEHEQWEIGNNVN